MTKKSPERVTLQLLQRQVDAQDERIEALDKRLANLEPQPPKAPKSEKDDSK